MRMLSRSGILRLYSSARGGIGAEKGPVNQGPSFKVVFYNTKDMEETKYNDKSVITVNRNGTPTVSSLKEIQNDHIYKGEENELILSQVYTTQFICEYDLRNYPFDVQKCSMIFIMQVRKDAFLYNVHLIHCIMHMLCFF